MSDLSIKGKVVQICNKESGVSKAGKEWEKQEFVIETEGEYPKKVSFTTFGDKISIIQTLSVGKEVIVCFNLESREYNGRWFHNVNAWKVDVVGQSDQVSEEIPPPPEPEDNSNDDSLPF